MEVEIKRLLEELPADPRRHLDQDRVRRYAEVLDQLPPVTVFELEDHTLLLTDGGGHGARRPRPGTKE
jgi:hypothetical protein